MDHGSFVSGRKMGALKIVELGFGWAQNTINTVIFRHHGLITRDGIQISSWYNENGQIKVCKRNLKNNTISIVKPFPEEGNVNRFDAHNSISIGIDPLNYIHICYDSHSSVLNYRRSTQPLDISEWTDYLPMTGINEKQVTYPTFFNLNSNNGELFFLYRNGSSGLGDAILNKYDETEEKWVQICPDLLNGSKQSIWTSNAYWNNPITEKGLTLTYVWRLKSGGPSELVNNTNICFAHSKDGIEWYTHKGKELMIPITQANSDVICGIPVGENLINQTSSAVDSKGNIHVAYYSNDENGIPQYKHLFYNGRTWENHIVSQRTKKFDLSGGGALQIPMSRPEIVIDKSDNVYLIYRCAETDNRMIAQKIKYPWGGKKRIKNIFYGTRILDTVSLSLTDRVG